MIYSFAVAADKMGKLSIEYEMKSKRYEQQMVQKDKQMDLCKSNISEWKTKYNKIFLEVFEQKSLQTMSVLKHNKVEIEKYDLKRISLQTIILEKEEELKKVGNKTKY